MTRELGRVEWVSATGKSEAEQGITEPTGKVETIPRQSVSYSLVLVRGWASAPFIQGKGNGMAEHGHYESAASNAARRQRIENAQKAAKAADRRTVLRDRRAI